MKRRIVIASHADLSVGLKNAAKLIVGPSADEIITFTLYEGDSTEAFRKEIEALVVNHEDEEFVVLTDLLSASVFNELVILSKYSNVFLFAGVNLIMVIDMLTDLQPLTSQLCEEKLAQYREMVTYSKISTTDMEDNDF